MTQHAANITTKQPQSMKSFFSRYHAVIFFVLTASELSVAIFLFYQVATSPGDVSIDTSQSTSSSFDEATITKVRGLHTPGQTPASPDFPSGRIDPFPN